MAWKSKISAPPTYRPVKEKEAHYVGVVQKNRVKHTSDTHASFANGYLQGVEDCRETLVRLKHNSGKSAEPVKKGRAKITTFYGKKMSRPSKSDSSSYEAPPEQTTF